MLCMKNKGVGYDLMIDFRDVGSGVLFRQCFADSVGPFIVFIVVRTLPVAPDCGQFL